MPVSQEKLYEDVWAEPMTTAARRYDVSAGARFHHLATEACDGHKAHHGLFDGPGTGRPARPTVALYDETAFGITVFEVSENVAPG